MFVGLYSSGSVTLKIVRGEKDLAKGGGSSKLFPSVTSSWSLLHPSRTPHQSHPCTDYCTDFGVSREKGSHYRDLTDTSVEDPSPASSSWVKGVVSTDGSTTQICELCITRTGEKDGSYANSPNRVAIGRPTPVCKKRGKNQLRRSHTVESERFPPCYNTFQIPYGTNRKGVVNALETRRPLTPSWTHPFSSLVVPY